MEAIIAIIKNLLQKTSVAIGVGLAAGLLIGLLFGWVVWPVEWTDGTPEVLRADLQRDYLRMTIDSYNRTGDVDTALARWDNLGDDANAAFLSLRSDPGYLDVARIDEFGNLVQSVKGIPIQAPAADVQAGGLSQLVIYGSIAVVAILLGVGGLYAWRLFRKGSGTVTPMMEAAEHSRSVERTDFQALGVAPPIAQSVTTYVMGDDLYDESFKIDSPSGKYLGEYGVGICEKIGVGQPKKVAALDIWLFEVDLDAANKTKVLMSEHAYNDPAIRARLEPKGELVLIRPGEQVYLETASLQLLATVVDLEYGMGSMPANSHFQRVTLELAVWPKTP